MSSAGEANDGYATIGGGGGNVVQSFANFSTIGGGKANTIATNGAYATIPGGYSNSATNYAFAAGNRAKANHTGSFVWADSTAADFADTVANQFLIRASGGVGIGTNNPQSALHVAGTVTATAFKGDGSQLTGISGGAPAGVLTNNQTSVTLGGTFSGNGAGLTGLNPASLGAGTAGISISGNAATATTATNAINFTGSVLDSQLSANITRINGTNVFTGTNTFSGPLIMTNQANRIVIENRSADPTAPVTGQIWIITP